MPRSSTLSDLLGSPYGPALLLMAGSGALLGGALFFQYVVGLPPCVLCLWQRWPHAAVLALGGLALLFAARRDVRGGLLALCGAALLIGAGIAVFHVGVEQHWWAGTSQCGGAGSGAASLEELRAQILNAPVVRCDDVPWSLFGISMAGYNALISLALAALALGAAWRTLTARRDA